MGWFGKRLAPRVVATVVLGGCGGDGGGPTPGPEPRVTTITASGGTGQVGPAGAPLADSLAVIVRDQAGAPIAGVTVTWAAGSGGGSVSPGTTTTGSNGIARTRRTLGPNAGTQATTATAGSLTPVTINAVAQIQGAVVMGSRSIGPLTDTVLGTLTEFEQPLIVLVLDQNGVPVRNVQVTWTASGGGSVSPIAPGTNSGGESTAEYTFGATAGGGYGAVAEVPGLIGSPVIFDLSALPATPVTLTKSGGDSLVVQAGGQVVHTVLTRDSYGNPTHGVGIDWAATAGGGSITPAHAFTGNDGRGEATRTLGAGLGEQTATASAPGMTGSPVVTFTTTAAATVVRVVNNFFVPGAAMVQQHDSVAWQWNGTIAAHNITFAAATGAPANAPDRTSGVVWRTFGTVGTFSYQCTNHPGMSGTVEVVP